MPAAPAAQFAAVVPIGLHPSGGSDAGSSCLGQLKAALAALTTTITGGPARGTSTRLNAGAVSAEARLATEEQSEAMSELLLALGFVPVPAAFQPAVPTAPGGCLAHELAARATAPVQTPNAAQRVSSAAAAP